ncbi:hypothetical protein KO465_00685 [Candidatus Micrarchaeota archaeon]|nr:hypothetical protein [Candidatus Micrarchaeota archaeon]
MHAKIENKQIPPTKRENIKRFVIQRQNDISFNFGVFHRNVANFKRLIKEGYHPFEVFQAVESAFTNKRNGTVKAILICKNALGVNETLDLLDNFQRKPEIALAQAFRKNTSFYGTAKIFASQNKLSESVKEMFDTAEVYLWISIVDNPSLMKSEQFEMVCQSV